MTPRPTIKRIGGYLYKIIPVIGSTGKIIEHVIHPLMVELKPRDIMQIIVGAALLAVPMGFTEEVWNLGVSLSFERILILSFVSILFVGVFVYFNFYRMVLFKDHYSEFIKRILAIYILSILVVASLLTLIDKCPWGVDNILAIKRILIIAFPASMSASLSDSIK